MSYFDFKLNTALDVRRAVEEFRTQRRCQVQKVLPKELAVSVHGTLAHRTPWNYTYFDGTQAQTMPLQTYADLSDEARQSITRQVMQTAQNGFAYSYNSFNFHQRFLAGDFPDHPLRELDVFLNGDDFLSFARGLTGDREISGSDASASWYGPNHFLNIHNDSGKGYDRRAAFVLNLTPEWRTNWGGELKFFSDRRGSRLECAYFPGFNMINVFAVPQYHAVGVVAPFAGGPRLSVSGWLYAGKAPY